MSLIYRPLSEECRHLGGRGACSFTVGEEGLEPSRPFGHRNLNPARLPIPPLARAVPDGNAGSLEVIRGSPHN